MKEPLGLQSPDTWEEDAGLAKLTCQCFVTAFHTPMRPVWLVAMSWFPTKNKASTGTPRWKTPVGSKERLEAHCRGRVQ